jgi:two-component system chemotaxis response regulator CheY
VATILVVDDAAFMRMRMSKILSEAGYDVIQAENGLDAVQKYKGNRPDAVLMDITMPEMDGLTALKEIKAHDPGARVAMVTALGQQQIVLEAVKSGAKDFLVKPCEGDRVLAAVSKLCA